ncbi:MAG: hypothetical protein Q4P72_02215 [Eubacteriales bacterium]|nr:hypothetical protein [Eubacteriales bacterium]
MLSPIQQVMYEKILFHEELNRAIADILGLELGADQADFFSAESFMGELEERAAHGCLQDHINIAETHFNALLEAMENKGLALETLNPILEAQAERDLVTFGAIESIDDVFDIFLQRLLDGMPCDGIVERGLNYWAILGNGHPSLTALDFEAALGLRSHYIQSLLANSPFELSIEFIDADLVQPLGHCHDEEGDEVLELVSNAKALHGFRSHAYKITKKMEA